MEKDSCNLFWSFYWVHQGKGDLGENQHTYLALKDVTVSYCGRAHLLNLSTCTMRIKYLLKGSRGKLQESHREVMTQLVNILIKKHKIKTSPLILLLLKEKSKQLVHSKKTSFKNSHSYNPSVSQAISQLAGRGQIRWPSPFNINKNCVDGSMLL